MYRIADPQLLEKLALEHEDTITGPFQEELAQITRKPCPRCGGEVRPEMQTQKLIQTGNMRVCFLARCLTCGCLFNPDMGIIVELGNLARARPDCAPILKKEDS